MGSAALTGADVVLLRWPEEAARLERLRGVRRAAVAPRGREPGPTGLGGPARGLDPPAGGRGRSPGTRRDPRRPCRPRPGRARHVDEDGLLRYRSRWVTLSPVERALAAALVDRFGAVVGRDSLVRHAWPGGSPTRNALDVHMLRLRRRIAGLGLEVRTVRARGYLLQAEADGADA